MSCTNGISEFNSPLKFSYRCLYYFDQRRNRNFYFQLSCDVLLEVLLWNPHLQFQILQGGLLMHSENQSYLGLVLQFEILDLLWLLFEIPVGKFNKYIKLNSWKNRQICHMEAVNYISSVICLPVETFHVHFLSNPYNIFDCLWSSFQILIFHLLEHFLDLEALQQTHQGYNNNWN